MGLAPSNTSLAPVLTPPVLLVCVLLITVIKFQQFQQFALRHALPLPPDSEGRV